MAAISTGTTFGEWTSGRRDGTPQPAARRTPNGVLAPTSWHNADVVSVVTYLAATLLVVAFWSAVAAVLL